LGVLNHMDTNFMEEALALARVAAEAGEVPVGAIVVHKGYIVGRGYDMREGSLDPAAHAEIVAIRAAAARLGTWRLGGCTLYVTLEPCVMCMGAVLHARMDCVVYGAASPKWGSVESVLELANVPALNHRVGIRSGVRHAECAALLETFFAKLRSRRGAREAEGA
jgi:tRNA(adenine34) deaminase